MPRPYTIEGPLDSFEPEQPVVLVEPDPTVRLLRSGVIDLTPVHDAEQVIDLTKMADDLGVSRAPDHVVVRFFDARTDGELDQASALVNPMILRSGGMPIWGTRPRLNRVARKMSLQVRSDVHDATVTGSIVETNRTDTLSLGRIQWDVPVNGQFVVTDGEILAWTDDVRIRDLVGGVLPGVLAAVRTSLRSRLTFRKPSLS